MSFRVRSRLVRLERAAAIGGQYRSLRLRYGHLKKLPRSYTGEKHVEITKALGPDEWGKEWFEYEERPGPAPPAEPSDEEIRDILIVEPEEEQ